MEQTGRTESDQKSVALETVHRPLSKSRCDDLAG